LASVKKPVSIAQCFGEFLGTFALLFVGTGAIIIDDLSGGAITHVGISLTFGLVVMTTIYLFCGNGCCSPATDGYT
jgi:aquaporin Z